MMKISLFGICHHDHGMAEQHITNRHISMLAKKLRAAINHANDTPMMRSLRYKALLLVKIDLKKSIEVVKNASSSHNSKKLPKLEGILLKTNEMMQSNVSNPLRVTKVQQSPSCHPNLRPQPTTIPQHTRTQSDNTAG